MSDRKLTKAFVKVRTPAHDPLSLESLIAWLETMPPEQRYCYSDTGACMAAQYNKALGREYEPPFGIDFDGMADFQVPFDEQMERIAARTPHTFGAALSRARSLQQGESDG